MKASRIIVLVSFLVCSVGVAHGDPAGDKINEVVRTWIREPKSSELAIAESTKLLADDEGLRKSFDKQMGYGDIATQLLWAAARKSRFDRAAFERDFPALFRDFGRVLLVSPDLLGGAKLIYLRGGAEVLEPVLVFEDGGVVEGELVRVDQWQEDPEKIANWEDWDGDYTVEQRGGGWYLLRTSVGRRVSGADSVRHILYWIRIEPGKLVPEEFQSFDVPIGKERLSEHLVATVRPAVEMDSSFEVVPDPAGKNYFPKDRASYYTKYLAAMKEPSVLAPLEKGVERVFRFTYLRSFHDPLVVRITEAGDTVTARAVRLERDQQYRPVKIVHDKTWKLDEKGREAVKPLPEQKGFWTPLGLVEEAIASGGLDGSQWIFEVHDKDGYRMIDVWTPDAVAGAEKDAVQRLAEELGDDPNKMRDFLIYKKTGEKLLEIGGILPEPDERY